jgi:CubicO group peptidase (beta-lactamase class C family)
MRDAVAVALAIGLGLGAQPSAQMMKVPAGFFEQAVQPQVDSNQYMGSVLVARGDIVLMNKGFGSERLTPATPNKPSTRFAIGSLTKQFTAAGILLLEERGKLALTDRLSQHLPDTPAAWSGITLFHLLTHTSGLPNTTVAATERAAVTTQKDIFEAARRQPLDFAPGERFNYSNTGYVALGLVIEKLAAQPYADFVRTSLFTPLGMSNSGYLVDGVAPGLATGYAAGPNGPAPFPAGTNFEAFAAGALYSTTEDLAAWQRGLFGGKVLTPASLAKMTTPFKNDYALGIESRLRNGRRVLEHSGGYGAFRNMMAYYPDDRVSVIVLSNMGSAASDIADRLGAMAHGQMKTAAPTTATPAVTLPAEQLARFAGTYSIRADDIVVTIEGGKLFLQTAQGRSELAAESETRFKAVTGDARVEFVVDAAGGATGMVLRQGGMMMKGPRKQ